MQTQFEPRPSAEPGSQNDEWAARPSGPRRSVFANYSQRPAAPSATDAPPQRRLEAARVHPNAEPLQTAIDLAMARSFLYRFLAQAYQDPAEDSWARMTEARCQHDLNLAVHALASAGPQLVEAAVRLHSQFKPELFETFLAAYLTVFGHAARGRCPLNEIEYGDIKADPLFQPHRLADLAGFYRAFGLEIAEDADERHDHICLELEFMCVLAAKEAYSLEHQLDPEALSVCRDAQKRFLREHLGRWIPAFTRRLARLAGDTPLGALADFTRTFVEGDCARHSVVPGSEDLLLRPVNEAAESICNACQAAPMSSGALNHPATPV